MDGFNRNLLELIDIIPDVVAGDANNDITGDWVKATNYERLNLLLVKPAGTAGDDLSIALQQATTAAGGSAKALTFTKLWYKKAASSNDFSTVPLWTAVELTSATSDLDLVSVNGVDLATDTVGTMILVEVLASSLDVTNGFDWVNVLYEGDDIGNALLINSHWIGQGPRFAGAIPLSAIS